MSRYYKQFEKIGQVGQSGTNDNYPKWDLGQTGHPPLGVSVLSDVCPLQCINSLKYTFLCKEVLLGSDFVNHEGRIFPLVMFPPQVIGLKTIRRKLNRSKAI